MPDTTPQKRSWAPCVCPICRFVFRIPKHHDGKGVVCPACNYLLRIPEGDRIIHDVRTPVFSAETQGASASASSDQNEVRNRSSSHSSSTGRKRIKVQRGGDKHLPDWEQDRSVRRATSKQGSPLLWILGGTGLGLSVLGVAAWLVIGNTGEKPVAPDKHNLSGVAKLPSVSEEKESSSEDTQEANEIRNTVNTGVDILQEAKGTVANFLEVTDVESFKDLVRLPKKSMPRIREWYKTHELKPIKVREIGYGSQVTVNGNLASVVLQMDDYTIKQIAIEKIEGKYRIDWESWVAWTEMDWEKFFINKPTEPKTVLVKCSLDSYYNRDFSDDKKWAAVRMTNPQSFRTMYGYIDKSDPSLSRFLADLNSGQLSATIKIRYLDNARAADQVHIVEHLYSGWVAERGGNKKNDNN